MNRARDHFLARAGLAGDEHGGGGGRCDLHLAHYILHRWGGADQSTKFSSGAQVARESHHGLLVADVAQRAFEQSAQHGRLQRLFDVPVGAGFDRLDDAFIAAAARDNDDGDAEDLVAQLLEQVEAVHAGQFDVREDQAGLEFLKFGKGFFAAADAENFPVPFAQQGLVAFAGIVFIFNDQNALLVGNRSGHRNFQPTSSLAEIQ